MSTMLAEQVPPSVLPIERSDGSGRQGWPALSPGGRGEMDGMVEGSLLEILVKRWRLLLFCLVVAVALGIGYLLTAEPVYRCVSRMVIDRQSVRMDTGAAASPVHLETECEMFRSKPVLSRYLSSITDAKPAWLSGASDPLEWLRQRIDVRVARGTEVVSVSVETNDRAEAVSLVEGVLRSYREVRQEQRRQRTSDSLKRLESELEARRGELAVAATRMAESRASLGEGMTDAAAATVRNRLAELSEQLLGAQRQRLEAQMQSRQASVDGGAALRLRAAQDREEALLEMVERQTRLMGALQGPREPDVAASSEVRRLERLCGLVEERMQAVRLAESMNETALALLEAPAAQMAPVWPQKMRVLGMSVVLGLLVGSVSALAGTPRAKKTP